MHQEHITVLIMSTSEPLPLVQSKLPNAQCCTYPAGPHSGDFDFPQRCHSFSPAAVVSQSFGSRSTGRTAVSGEFKISGRLSNWGADSVVGAHLQSGTHEALQQLLGEGYKSVDETRCVQVLLLYHRCLLHCAVLEALHVFYKCCTYHLPKY